MVTDVLIIERVAENISITKVSDNSYIFEGTFTVFDVRNNNNRFYRKENVLPLIEQLQSKVKTNRLLGELDHPDDFIVELKRVSHVIQELRYDEATNSIKGKIQLVGTERGKDAQALVDAGVPLHISSRASGTIMDDGNVRLNKLYTYDLVADPGFSQAQLTQVSESLERSCKIMNKVPSKFELITESSNDKIKIYKIKESAVSNEREQRQEMLNKYITQSNREFADVHKRLSLLESEVPKTNIADQKMNTEKGSAHDAWKSKYDEMCSKYDEMVEKYEMLEKRLSVSENYCDYLRENVEKIGTYSEEVLAPSIEKIGTYAEDVLAPSIEKVADYSENYLRENIEKIGNYTNYLTENIEKVGTYAEEYLRENVEKLGKYSEYLRENIEKVGNYTEGYIRENVENLGQYTEYLRKNIENIGNYAEGYLVEHIVKLANYTDYLRENIENVGNYAEGHLLEGLKLISETINGGSLKIAEGKIYEGVNPSTDNNEIDDFKQTIAGEISKFRLAVENKNNAKVKALNENKSETKIDLTSPVIKFMPNDIREKWDTLSINEKKVILDNADNYVTETQNQVENFWYRYADFGSVKDTTIVTPHDNDNQITENTDTSDFFNKLKQHFS